MGDADTGNDHLSDVDLPSQSALASLAEQPGDAAAKPRPKPPSESGAQTLVSSSKTNPRLGDLWYLFVRPDFFNREQSRANSANPSKLVALTRALTRG